jgi:hypothetical protein
MYDSLTHKPMRRDDDTVFYLGPHDAMRATSSMGEERRTNRRVQPVSRSPFLQSMVY